MPDGHGPLKRIAITGMSINTPLGDILEVFLDNLLQGRSAITRWKALDAFGIYSKVGGDLSEYDIVGKASSLRKQIPHEVSGRLRRLMRYSPWSTKLSILMAVDAFLDASLFTFPVEPERVSAIVAGHNINSMHSYRNWQQFVEGPNHIDALYALSSLDSDHAGCVADVLGIQGSAYTVGGACASGNVALRCAMDEIRLHNMDIVLVVGAVYDASPLELHSLAMMGAISVTSFNAEPAKASRPFDMAREGFVPSHGGGALILEDLDHAENRGARIYGELLGVEVSSAASRLPGPSEEHEAQVIGRVLRNTGIDPRKIDFVSAHATSTQVGDMTEIRALQRVFGDHARSLKINAPKSMLGHTCWSSAVVETVAALLQMVAGRFHPSTNIDHLDPGIDIDVCANRMTEHPVHYLLKNAFGMGGINSASIIHRPPLLN
jgi:3-oxoacyl-(acyl-carrier-protein) synthase